MWQRVYLLLPHSGTVHTMYGSHNFLYSLIVFIHIHMYMYIVQELSQYPVYLLSKNSVYVTYKHVIHAIIVPVESFGLLNTDIHVLVDITVCNIIILQTSTALYIG